MAEDEKLDLDAIADRLKARLEAAEGPEEEARKVTEELPLEPEELEEGKSYATMIPRLMALARDLIASKGEPGDKGNGS